VVKEADHAVSTIRHATSRRLEEFDVHERTPSGLSQGIAQVCGEPLQGNADLQAVNAAQSSVLADIHVAELSTKLVLTNRTALVSLVSTQLSCCILDDLLCILLGLCSSIEAPPHTASWLTYANLLHADGNSDSSFSPMSAKPPRLAS